MGNRAEDKGMGGKRTVEYPEEGECTKMRYSGQEARQLRSVFTYLALAIPTSRSRLSEGHPPIDVPTRWLGAWPHSPGCAVVHLRRAKG